jgi:acylphosphatase
MKRSRVIVRGRVQGVFFRDTIRRRAHAAGVAGWARNRADGSVETVFEGDEDAVRRLEDFCRLGPPQAHVTEVEVFDEPPEGLEGFAVD